ncbi:Outer membrane protein OmpA-like peptidoglycan-associated protein [Vibrio crassostreae]|uniref:OmpA family protein n=1 Tax=Vibrio crassostreae TaxID=246167 RepID=UPI000F4AB2FC|nr:OmpA family protein [Vibrio crassostreae]ROR13966.1 outer membrane protein OmpA-like peptidoglycan-associated protein [Vibrio crassostreae]CAK1703219.1 Outer membrane protein OmpA-like peptidoglycan-associated protein [Vibrio crassostreae]CAK2369851.1 Outer membrane protein OmpA-like peptidoglycan-associated protein [Vibrio crassostreae]CAK2381900.1 Outer membrane protein OmpA-like peptidoglycan-associated protein [Vibrio crassostreae]CAK3027312.1 Outer membrane protein OmpA-like peptidogly
MKKLKNYIALSLSVLVLGCTSYPEQGTGGLAESYDSINYQNSDFSPVMPDEPLGPEHGLRFDWQLAKLQLDALIQEGARWCFPAAVVQAIEKQNRIARELQGGLLLDAANDLVIQRKRLNELEVQLDYVTSQARCEPPQNENQFRIQLSVIEQLYDLLNVDNQFAQDSTEVNPKYMGKLAEASYILKENKSLDLIVTGHADATGSEEYNDKLALGRAKQVERYLTIFGLSPQRIKAVSVGETVPLFEGETAGTLLTNRRVSIEIISPKNAAKMGGAL